MQRHETPEQKARRAARDRERQKMRHETPEQKARRAERDRERRRTSPLTDEQKARRAERQRGRTRPPKPPRHFVALDSEGSDIGPPCEAVIAGKKNTYREHRSFLWIASDGETTQRLDRGGAPLSSDDILEWLCNLNRAYPRGIFVGFALGYDCVQAFKDLPEKNLWELQNQRPWATRDNPSAPKPKFFQTEYKEYKISYRRGKQLVVRRKDEARATSIYDVFSYFQCSFIKACGGANIPAEQMALIVEGKVRRTGFDPRDDLEFAARYSIAECAALVTIMDGVRDAATAIGLSPTRWHGPGALASEAIRVHGVRDHYWPMKAEDEDEPQLWARHAYFGGRIELTAMGRAPRLYGHDIRSAYPSICVQLPSMKGGRWVYHDQVDWGRLAGMSMLSMVHVKSRLRPQHTTHLLQALFYPLPWRKGSAVYFPARVNGYYMRDEALAALEFQQAQVRQPPLPRSPKHRRADQYQVELYGAWEFIPANDEKPFTFVRDMYEERKNIPKTDARNQVLKLVINSIYGKTAQAVGAEVPRDACIWYAAAITAGTRAQLLRAALTVERAGGDVVMFATDGLLSRGAPAAVTASDELGDWEVEELTSDSIMVKSGIYAAGVVKTRGVNPDNLAGTKENWIRTEVVNGWIEKRKKLTYSYTRYVTLGQAVTSAAMRPMLGCWASTTRDLSIDDIGGKRACRPASKTVLPENELCFTTPSGGIGLVELLDGTDCRGREMRMEDVAMSAPYKPEWLIVEDGMTSLDMQEQEQIALAVGR